MHTNSCSCRHTHGVEHAIKDCPHFNHCLGILTETGKELYNFECKITEDAYFIAEQVVLAIQLKSDQITMLYSA